MLDDEPLLAHLVDEARLIADAFARCDPAAPVPGLDWDAQTVVMHTGAVHRWAADIVARSLGTNETGGSMAFSPAVADAPRLAVWLDEGVAILISALRNAPASLTCFTFVPGMAPRTFWIRRQAHETAIHRADVEAAAGGPVTSVDASFAQDGLARSSVHSLPSRSSPPTARDGYCSKPRTARRGWSRSAASATSSRPATSPERTPTPSPAALATSSTAGPGTARHPSRRPATRRCSPRGALYVWNDCPHTPSVR